MRLVRLMVGKDLRLEWRTREIVTTMGLLALLLVIVFGATRSDPEAAPVAMWITYAFGAALGFTRTFTLERDHLTALRLAPVDRGAIFASKALANWLLLTTVQVVSLPLFGALFTETIWAHLPALALPLGLGGAGLAAVGTLYGALIAQTRLREALLPILMLPVVLPALIAAVGATAGILDGQPLSAVAPQLQRLGDFEMLVAASGLLLFDVIVDE
jgi:heme exporter protein B